MTSRGGDITKTQQKYANKTKFHLKFNEKATKMKTKTPLDRMCARCRDQLKWKLEYGKYKPLTAMARCVKCTKKNITKAYRTCCDQCSDDLSVCSKCLEQKEIVDDDNLKPGMEPFMKERQDAFLRKLRERSRKRVLRLLEKESIQFNGEVFVSVETGQELTDLQYKRDDNDDLDGLSYHSYASDDDDFKFQDSKKKEDD